MFPTKCQPVAGVYQHTPSQGVAQNKSRLYYIGVKYFGIFRESGKNVEGCLLMPPEVPNFVKQTRRK